MWRIAPHHALATEAETVSEFEIPGGLGLSALSMLPDRGVLYAHLKGFNKFHVAMPQAGQWSWSTKDPSCGEGTICVLDGPMADRRPEVSSTVSALWVNDTAEHGVLTLELYRKSLLLELHTANGSTSSRCSCSEPDLLHGKHRYRVDVSFSANLPKSDYENPKTACVHSSERGFSVISIVDLVLVMKHDDRGRVLNVTQVIVILYSTFEAELYATCRCCLARLTQLLR